MEKKVFSIDFFTVRTDKDSSFSFTRYLESLERGDKSHIFRDSLNFYSIRNVTTNGLFYFGEFCKYRMDSLPHAGSANSGVERELPLDITEGLVEKNYFSYKTDDNVVIFQRNGNASRGQKIGTYLSDKYRETITLSPIVTGDSLKRIMSNRVTPVSLEASISRPTNKTLFPSDSFSRDLFNWMSDAGGSRLHFTLTSDQRSNADGRSTLSDRAKSAVSSLFGREDVSVLRAQVRNEDGLIEPIDLVADRIYSQKNIRMNGRYPDPNSIISSLKESFEEKSSEIYEVIGQKNERLN